MIVAGVQRRLDPNSPNAFNFVRMRATCSRLADIFNTQSRTKPNRYLFYGSSQLARHMATPKPIYVVLSSKTVKLVPYHPTLKLKDDSWDVFVDLAGMVHPSGEKYRGLSRQAYLSVIVSDASIEVRMA